jgi:heme-degrading monooxygenase HmoA
VIVVTSRIRVRRGSADALASQYVARIGRADASPGCLGIEILRRVDAPEEFMVYSRWESAAAYDAYRASSAFREAHERIRLIPGGISVERMDEGAALFEVLS